MPASERHAYARNAADAPPRRMLKFLEARLSPAAMDAFFAAPNIKAASDILGTSLSGQAYDELKLFARKNPVPALAHDAHKPNLKEPFNMRPFARDHDIPTDKLTEAFTYLNDKLDADQLDELRDIIFGDLAEGHEAYPAGEDKATKLPRPGGKMASDSYSKRWPEVARIKIDAPAQAEAKRTAKGTGGYDSRFPSVKKIGVL